MDFENIKKAAGYEQAMTKFYVICQNSGRKCRGKGHIDRIAEEMRALDFDQVEIDPMGNVLGYMGTGKN